MSIKNLLNKSVAKHEEHPFHILPPSYLPFVVAMSAGTFVATFAALMHADTLKESIPFFNFIVIGVPDYYRLGGLFMTLIGFIFI